MTPQIASSRPATRRPVANCRGRGKSARLSWGRHGVLTLARGRRRTPSVAAGRWALRRLAALRWGPRLVRSLVAPAEVDVFSGVPGSSGDWRGSTRPRDGQSPSPEQCAGGARRRARWKTAPYVNAHGHASSAGTRSSSCSASGDGRSVPRARSRPASRRRHQVPPAAFCQQSRAPGALRAGGTDRLVAEPSQHHHDPRDRHHARRAAVHRDGVRPGTHPARAAAGGAVTGRDSSGYRLAARRRHGQGACRRASCIAISSRRM